MKSDKNQKNTYSLANPLLKSYRKKRLQCIFARFKNYSLIIKTDACTWFYKILESYYISALVDKWKIVLHCSINCCGGGIVYFLKVILRWEDSAVINSE